MKGTKPHLKKSLDALTKAPPAPKWLPQFSVAEWKRVTPALVHRGILTEDNLGCLENYCLAIGTVRTMQAVIKKEGHFVTSREGVKRPHPAHRLQKDAITQARQYAAELGLTPVSRSRPSMAAVGDGDEWAGMVDG